MQSTQKFDLGVITFCVRKIFFNPKERRPEKLLADRLTKSEMDLDDYVARTKENLKAKDEEIQRLREYLLMALQHLEACHPMNPAEPCNVYENWKDAKTFLGIPIRSVLGGEVNERIYELPTE